MLAGILTKKTDIKKKIHETNCGDVTRGQVGAVIRTIVDWGEAEPSFFPPSFRTKVTLGEWKGIRWGGGTARLLKRNPPPPSAWLDLNVSGPCTICLKKKKV